MKDTQGTLATTACRLCREQKVRCSHELPECARCSKLGLECAYPEPPDRRLIAARRAQPRKRSAWDSRETPESQTSQQKRPRAAPIVIDDSRPEGSDAAPFCLKGMESQPKPSPEARKLLYTAYLTCAFNSSLTFHHPSFRENEAKGIIPKHTLLAAQALGANFLAPLVIRGREHYAVMRHLGDLRSTSENWALAAGKLALQEADDPTLYMVQTCQILSLFWFSRGDSRRNTMFSGIGYRAIRAIVVESIEKLTATMTTQTRVMQNLGSEELGVRDAECIRRLFWASWTTNVINSDHYIPGSAADTLVLTLPLPVSEVAFLNNTEEPLAIIAQDSSKSLVAQSRSPHESSIMAEIMKCLIIWARIRDHIDMRRTLPQKEAWFNAYSIQSDITTWLSQLHPDLQYSKRNLYHQLVVKQQPTYIMLHALHHQSLLVLNSSLVPHFSGIPLARDMPVEVVRVSAAVVMRSVRALSDLSAHLVALEWDPTQIAPFVGYCMYAAASVQISALPRRRSGTTSPAWENLTSCMRLLKLMKPYWAVLDRLWTRILPTYDAQIANRRRAPGTPMEEPTEEEEQEFLTSPKADAENAQDPGETSVLQYSLRTLHDPPSTNSRRSVNDSPEATRPTAISVPAGDSHNNHIATDSDAPNQQQKRVEAPSGGIISSSGVPMQASSRPPALLNNNQGLLQQIPQDSSFEPLHIAFQGSFESFDTLDVNTLEENDWFQLDMESSSQARQAFNHFF